ncbi:MAG: glycosyltransferase [Alsobacter sp.]
MSDRRPLRVVSVAHTAVKREAGRTRYHPLARRADLDVHLVVPRVWQQFGRTLEADPPGDPGVTLHVMPILFQAAGPMSWYLHLYPGLPRLLRTVRPDVIHLWEEPWSLVALHAALLKGRAGLVLEVDQNILKRLPPPFEAIRRFVLRRTAMILSRDAEADRVVRACGYEGPIRRIGYGVNESVFHPPLAPRERPAGAPMRLGYVGRLVVEKGLDDALEALRLAGPGIELAILGEGPHETALRQRAAALGLQDRVSFQGWTSPQGVAEFTRGLDALVLLTRTTHNVREQFGRVIIEAQNCGVPVIGTTCGAIPEVVGEGGWIVPESDPAALAALLTRLAGDEEERRRRAVAGRRNTATRFTTSIIASILADAWTSAAAPEPAHGLAVSTSSM